MLCEVLVAPEVTMGARWTPGRLRSQALAASAASSAVHKRSPTEHAAPRRRARGVSPCPSPRQDTGHGSARQRGVLLRHSVLCPGCKASPPPHSGCTDPLLACFPLNPACTAPQALGSRVGNQLSTPNCSAQKAVAACCLFFLCFPPAPLSLFKSSFETKTSCSLKWTIRTLRQLQPKSFSSWQEDQNYKTISLRQIMHSSSSFETKYDLQFNFP